jgi:hypothetical protein
MDMTNIDGDRYTSPEAYEDAIMREALEGGSFTVYRYQGGVNQKLVLTFDTFSAAALDAYSDPTAVVYAVNAQGRSALMPRKRWGHFNHIERSMTKE